MLHPARLAIARPAHLVVALALCASTVAAPSVAQPTFPGLNRVPNADFLGARGQALGATGTVPTLWRAFAVSGGAARTSVQNVAPGALFQSSPATRAVLLDVTNTAGDAGFDHEGFQFGLESGHTYQAEVYLRTTGGRQMVSVSIPIFQGGTFTGQTPGSFQVEVDDQWRLYRGPGFTATTGQTADLAFRLIDDGGANRVLIAQPSLGGPDRTYPVIQELGRGFSKTDRYVATSFFHWYNAQPRSQREGPWRPLEGRAAWTGTTDFWREQIKDVMDAGIDVLYVHLLPDFEGERVELFRALADLRADGYDVPYAAPFLDTVITWDTLFSPAGSVDLSTVAGKDEFVDHYARWYEQYFAAENDAAALSYLLEVDGRAALNTWHMFEPWVVNRDQLSRNDVESRLRQAFASSHPTLFDSGVYMIATENNAPPWVDERIHQFSNTEYFSAFGGVGVRSATMKAGYWDQNIRDPGLFLARNGGGPYENAWDELVNESDGSPPGLGAIFHAYIESWNEYDEGTGIYAAVTDPPVIGPENNSGNDDTWSTGGNPREYIDTTARGAARFRQDTPRDAEFLWHDVPAQVEPGQPLTLRFLVRNAGTAEWNRGRAYRLEQFTTDSFVFGSGQHPIDDAAVETAKYGGAFRGRPVLFEVTGTAPATEGRYTFNWRMAGEGQRFGETLTTTVTVGDPPQVGPCVQDAATMCLENDRFEVTGTVVAQGETRTLQMVGLTADTGYGWFLNAQNLEVFVKVLDGCPINRKFWVFLGGLTDLQVELKVRNTITGQVFTKSNPARTNFQTESNTSFFDGCPAKPAAQVAQTVAAPHAFHDLATRDFGQARSALAESVALALSARTAPVGPTGTRDLRLEAAATGATCTADATTMCLENNRFAVTGRVVAQGETRTLQMVALTADTGYGWFLNAQNLEIFVKVLDGCAINQRFWVFLGGLTDLEVNLEVRNTITGQVFTKSNPPSTNFRTESDTSFFTGCPP